MPLDPIIANPAKFDSGDRLVDYNNFLLAGNRQEAMNDARRKRQEDEQLNFLIKKNTNAKGEIDTNNLLYDVAQAGLGTRNQAIRKDSAELSNLQSTGKQIDSVTGLNQEKTRTEVADQDLKHAQATEHTRKAYETAVNTYKGQLDAISPDINVGADQYAQWILHKYQDPLMGKVLRDAKHTPDEELANLKQIVAQGPKAFQDFLMRTRMGMAEATKKHTTVVDNGGTNVMVETNDHSFGASKPDTLQTWTVTDSPKAPKTTNNTYVNVALKTDEAYGKRQAEHRADDDHDLEKSANAAPDLIREADRIDGLLKSGQVFTGAAAPLQLGIEKVKDVFGKGDKEKIRNTEILNSSLSKRTLAAAQTSGLGTGNGFTDKDRDFLQDAQAGRITWDAGSIAYNNDIARRVARATIQKWKERHGDVEETGVGGRTYPKGTPTAPPRPATNPPAAAIQYLRQHPETAAAFDKKYGAGAAKRILGGK